MRSYKEPEKMQEGTGNKTLKILINKYHLFLCVCFSLSYNKRIKSKISSPKSFVKKLCCILISEFEIWNLYLDFMNQIIYHFFI